MLPIELLVVTVAAIGNIVLGLFTYFKNPKNKTNTLFFLFALVLASYIVVNYLALHQSTDSRTLLFIRIVIALAFVINICFFLLAYTFPKPKLIINSRLFTAAVVLTAMLVPMAFTSLIYKAVNPGTTTPIAGPAIMLLVIHTLLFLGGGFFVLIRKFRQYTGTEKTQVKLLLFGTIVMFLAIVITNLLFVVLLGTTMFVGLLPIYTLAFVSIISYAIAKHRFLDIRLLVARSVAYALLLFILATFYTGAVFSISNILFEGSYGIRQTLVYTVLAMFTAFTFQPLKAIVEQVTNRIFFKNRYDANTLLSSLTKIMASTLHPQDLTMHTLHTLTQGMHITRGAFLIYEDSKFLPPVYEGFSTVPVYDGELIRFFTSFRRMLVFDVEEEAIKAKMREVNIAIAMPLFVGYELQGVLLLGEKQSGDIYAEQDIKVLEIFGPEIAVALQNANSYEEIRRFNITLREEVRKATADLQIANERLKELDKLKDDFVSVASHELRTPMTAIKSYLWMALHKTKEQLSPNLSRYLDRSYLSVERLISLVNDMLNISRIEGGKIALTLNETDIVGLANEVKEEVTAKATEKHVVVTVEAANIPKVLCDKDKVHQVYLNLIGNSLKFTPENGQITIRFAQQDQFVSVSVTDTGHGIAQEDLARLFKKFGRLDNSYVAMAESSGTGLGLYISKSLIHLHKGEISGTSEGVGKGSTFSFTLPIVGSDIAKQLAQDAPKESNESKGLEPVSLA